MSRYAETLLLQDLGSQRRPLRGHGPNIVADPGLVRNVRVEATRPVIRRSGDVDVRRACLPSFGEQLHRLEAGLAIAVAPALHTAE